MSKGGKQTVTTSPDTATQQWMQQVRDAATRAGNAGPPSTGATGGYYNSAMGAGDLGMRAMSGDPNAISTFMNPYTQNVLDAQNGLWGTINKGTMAGADAAATAQHAFGGSRAAVMKANLLSQNNAQQGAQGADLLRSGYNDAMGRAQGVADLGFSGAGANAQLAQMNDPNAYRMRMLQSAYGAGPAGQTQTMTQQSGQNPFTGLLGGAAVGKGLGMGNWGTIAGGLLGML